ncbi:MAG TPA: glycosyltransferase family 39 protein [Thermoanaerobaculia bacterium]|nr:glycosyltransferase family 39 protein [Thermoanaerobaculia bacterium]
MNLKQVNWREWIGAAIVLAARLMTMPRTFWENDEFLFAEAVRNFDPSRYHPHPPGFPLYVLIGKFFNSFFGDPFLSLMVVSLLASVIGFVALARAFRLYLGDPDLAVAGALLFQLSCAMLVQAPLPMSDGPSIMFLALAFLAMARLDAVEEGAGGDHQRDALLTGLWCSAAIGVRPQLAIPLLPVFVLALWRMRRSAGAGKQRVAAVATFGFVSLMWFLPLMDAAGGFEKVIAYERKQAQYFATHDAAMSRGAIPFREIATRFLIHPWGSKYITIPLLLCIALGIWAIWRKRALVLRSRDGKVNILPIALFTAIYLIFELGAMDPSDGARYSLPAMMFVALVAACGFGVIQASARSSWVPWIAAAFFAGISLWYVDPIVAERTKRPSPVAMAAEYAKAHFAPGTVILYELSLRPHAEYLMSRFPMMPIEKGLVQYYDQPSVPLVLFGDGGSMVPEAKVFSWKWSDAYGKLTRNHYRRVTLDPIRPEERYLPVSGVYALERTIDGEEWRWLAPDATIRMPHQHRGKVTLSFGLSHDAPYDRNAVDVFVNGATAGRGVATRPKPSSLEVALPDVPDVEIRMRSERSFTPAKVLGNRDPRLLAAQLVGVEQK